jgi:phenylacetic acid degradation operon negative regulatory protein
MSLTPMQEIFILLEDEKEVALFRLNRWGRQARGVLAKLTKLGWAAKSPNASEPSYRITEKGEKAIDNILKPLKAGGTWDGRWRLVMFDVPESKRALRDRLRRDLTKLGLGILQASVWISPNDIKDDITKLCQKYDIGPSLKFFEVSRNQNLDKTIIEKSWNLPEISDEYKMFNLHAERILKSIDRDPNQKFTAKKLIFELALIKQKDPFLPVEFRDQDALRNKAQELYQSLRSYII